MSIDRSSPLMSAYFFGVAPGRPSGHFLHDERYRHPDPDPETPWGKGDNLEGVMPLAWGRTDFYAGQQPEGTFRFLRRDGWTLATAWDRSADRRGGCCAIFAFDRDLSDAEAVRLAKELFPAVFDRIEHHLGRRIAVAPAACPCCRRPL